MGNPLTIRIDTPDGKDTAIYFHWGAESDVCTKHLTQHYIDVVRGAATQKEVVERIFADDVTIGLCTHCSWYTKNVYYRSGKVVERYMKKEHNKVLDLGMKNNWREGNSRTAGLVAVSPTAIDSMMNASDNSVFLAIETNLQDVYVW